MGNLNSGRSYLMTAVKSAVEPSLKVPFSGHVGVENEDESKSQNMYCLLIG